MSYGYRWMRYREMMPQGYAEWQSQDKKPKEAGYFIAITFYSDDGNEISFEYFNGDIWECEKDNRTTDSYDMSFTVVVCWMSLPLVDMEINDMLEDLPPIKLLWEKKD